MPKRSHAVLSLLLFCTTLTQAEDVLRPYKLASNDTGTLSASITDTRALLEKSSFEVVGEYSPYPGAAVIAVTHPTLLAAAATREFGGYAAVLRIGLTQVGGEVQRSYANPLYWGTALQVGSLDAVEKALGELLGEGKAFGSKKGLSSKKLSSYRYMMMMPRLKDHDLLGSFNSHAEALATIRQNLETNQNKLNPVFEVAIPGQEEVLFGVGIGSGDGNDSDVMATTDSAELKHTAHLPYGLLVSGADVYALAGKFRIALAFPDLGMATFMKISSAPGAIRESLGSLADPIASD
ncbi:hypothetical protein R0137_04525 [Congregibacter brevis]|uniref:Uncharacterized protein n=1 Tax=Congregibacter brevis TaxID=3081201 RepID=A0ABZ0IG74_9GAMM|nr:hypothetical protein R0137_04525 [Congregibacter sp. IMCC45268]